MKIVMKQPSGVNLEKSSGNFGKILENKCFKIGPFQKIGFICFNKSPLKMMKNAFYFI